MNKYTHTAYYDKTTGCRQKKDKPIIYLSQNQEFLQMKNELDLKLK